MEARSLTKVFRRFPSLFGASSAMVTAAPIPKTAAKARDSPVAAIVPAISPTQPEPQHRRIPRRVERVGDLPVKPGPGNQANRRSPDDRQALKKTKTKTKTMIRMLASERVRTAASDALSFHFLNLSFILFFPSH
jgi:hypothetical protein